MSANLILHWMLDTLDEGKSISDETDNHLNGTYAGNLKAVPDAKFGSCLYFDGNGNSITTPDKSALRLHNYTAEVWIKPEQTNEWQGVLDKPGCNYNILIGAEGYINHCFDTGKKSNVRELNTENGSIVWGQWHHVAITNNGQTACTYINGILKAKGTVDGKLVIHNTPLIVGRSAHNTPVQYYKGCMAHLRLYDGVLALEEIRRDMFQDESAASAFVRSHPLDFELYNEDNHHVLFIDDHPEGQTLTLDILNSSTQNIELNNLGQTATPQAHHLQLQFRPETLARANLVKINVATNGWSLDRTPDGTALYLLYQGLKTLKAGERTSLQLTGMNADGRGGTRGTGVELVYKNMHYVGEESLLDGSRLQYLNIVNHQGRRNIPLHVGFVGSDTVLSDGKTLNRLRLRIANLSRDFDLRLSKGDAAKPSRFRISFDVQAKGETREWALTDYGTVNGASLHVTKTLRLSSKLADPAKQNLGQTVEWTVVFSENTTLRADEYIILELRDLVALASIGHANIYIDFENIPGYQDQRFTVTVQKLPLLFQNNQVTIEAKNNLDAVLKVNQKGSGRAASFAGRVFIGGHENVTGDRNALVIKATSDNPALWVEQKGSGRAANFEGRVLIGGYDKVTENNHALIINAGSNNSALHVKQTGSGGAADFEGRVFISAYDKLKGDHNALYIDAVTHGGYSALYVEQKGSANAGYFESKNDGSVLSVKQNGLGRAAIFQGQVLIGSYGKVTGNRNALNIQENSNYQALVVKQKGSEGAAYFLGQVTINGDENKDALHIRATTVFNHAALYIEQKGSGHALWVEGKVGGNNGWNSTSDIRLKKEINSLKGSLDKALALRGVSFKWKTDEFPERNLPDGESIGLIAQEVEAVFPELVSENEGYKTLEYEKLVAVLIEAMKEQQKLVVQLQEEVGMLKKSSHKG